MLYLCNTKRKKKYTDVLHNSQPKILEHMKEESFYNHNYYRNPQTGEIILEECDELYNCCSFYSVDENLKRGKYLGDCYCEDYDWNREEDIKLEFYS